MFVQAIRKTQPTAAMSTQRTLLTSPTRCSRSGLTMIPKVVLPIWKIRVLLDDAFGHRPHVGARLFERHGLARGAPTLEACGCRDGLEQAGPNRTPWRQDLDVAHVRKPKCGRQHPNDVNGCSLTEHAPDHRRVAAKAPLPQPWLRRTTMSRPGWPSSA